MKKSKIEYPRWLAHYYENLRMAHAAMKQVYFAEDFARCPKRFVTIVNEIDNLLYKAEAIAVAEDFKQAKPKTK